MVQKITMFEVHLDDAVFGGEDTGNPADESDTSNLGRLVAVGLLVGLVVAIALRRQSDETDDDADEPESPVEVEIET